MRFDTLEELKAYCDKEGCPMGFCDDVSPYRAKFSLGNREVPNSITALPMEGCDADANGSPGELTERRYMRFASGGAGIVWLEATAVKREGRASPHQLYIHKKNTDSFKRLADTIRETGLKRNGYEPVTIVQLTHSGRYSKPDGAPAPVIAAHNPVLDKVYGIPPEQEPISDSELRNLAEYYLSAALMLKDAGFDGVDVKASHGYLLGELLGACTRTGDFGGSYENRTRFMLDVVRNIRSAAGNGFILGSRLSIYDAMPYPYGFGMDASGEDRPDLREPIRLIEDVYKAGVSITALTMGNPYYNPHINRPFDRGPYKPPEPPVKGVYRLISLTAEAKKAFPRMKIVGAGYTWLKQYAVQVGAHTLKQGWADSIGFGRQAFAYPDIANDILSRGSAEPNKVCITCSKCSQLMRSQGPAGCVVRDKDVYHPLYTQYCGKGGNHV